MLGKPSILEETTQALAFKKYGKGFSINPGKITRSSIPNLQAISFKNESNGPEPKI